MIALLVRSALWLFDVGIAWTTDHSWRDLRADSRAALAAHLRRRRRGARA
jgi:hypothetical protein